MPAPSHITVTAPPGRRAPVHKDDGSEPGGAVLYVEHGVVCRVRFSQAIRRSIGRGDMLPCDMNGGVVASAHLAAAANDLPGGKIQIADLAKKGSDR